MCFSFFACKIDNLHRKLKAIKLRKRLRPKTYKGIFMQSKILKEHPKTKIKLHARIVNLAIKNAKYVIRNH